MTDRKKPSVAFLATVVVVAGLLATASYAAAYLYMVEPTGVLVGGSRSSVRVPAYGWSGKGRIGGCWATIFEPAHTIDMLLRRERWYGSGK